MSFEGILVSEIFHSIQGETTLAGERFSFIRLTGCNLRCTYCDTAYAFKGGTRMSIEEILNTISPHQSKYVLLTGGEPLLQRNTLKLVESLKAKNYQISIETHGEISIEPFAGRARIIMDIKTPSSGMSRGGYKNNIGLLRSSDEVKFVIVSKEDYEWARKIVLESNFPTQTILFSAAQLAENSPAKINPIDSTWLAEKILEDRLPVRLQVQLHKVLWGLNRKGV